MVIRITDYGKNENGAREKEVVARLEKRELKKACRVLLKEIAKGTGKSLEKLLGAMEGFDPSDLDDMMDYEEFGGKEAFMEAMDRCADLDEECGFTDNGSEGDVDDDKDPEKNMMDDCGCMDEGPEEEPDWVKAMDKCLDLDEACGFTGDETEDEDKNGGFGSGFLEFIHWDEVWDRSSDVFLENVKKRGAVEMAKRRIMDGRLAPEMVHRYTDSLLGLIEKHGKIIREEVERRKNISLDSFLNDEAPEKGRSITDRLKALIREDRLKNAWYRDMSANPENGEDDDYNRYVEIMDIEDLVTRTGRLVQCMKAKAMEEMKPFKKPFDDKNLRLNADGHTFRLEA